MSTDGVTETELKRGEYGPDEPKPLLCGTCRNPEAESETFASCEACRKRICESCSIKRNCYVLCRECWTLECRAVMQVAFEMDRLLCRVRDDYGSRPNDKPLGAGDIQAELLRIGELLAEVV